MRDLTREGKVVEIDVARRLLRLHLAQICDSTQVDGGRLALGIEGPIRNVIARHMAV